MFQTSPINGGARELHSQDLQARRFRKDSLNYFRRCLRRGDTDVNTRSSSHRHHFWTLQDQISHKMVKGPQFSFAVIFLLALGMLNVEDAATTGGATEKCAYNKIRKPYPSGNDKPFKFCQQWQNRSCCTSDTVESINYYGQEKLDGTKWDLCGKLSYRCEMMFKYETCFYECEPNLGPWIIKRKKSKMERFKGLPICASSCDLWYDMCKHDYTCAKSWPRDMKWTKNGNICKPGAKCDTYQNVYGSGKALCENIWGSTFKYVSDNQKCLKLVFYNDKNPNQDVVQDIFG